MENNKILDIRSMVLCALFTALIAAGAFIKIPFPYVPITLQFLFTNLAGLLLGRKKGLIAVCLYIFIGLAGIPVFASGGGINYIFQPTFGYIIGFAGGAWLGGLISERSSGKTMTYVLAGFANMAVTYGIGLIYFYFMANYHLGNHPIGVKTLLISGFLLCIPGDILYCFVCGILAKRLQPILNKKKATA